MTHADWRKFLTEKDREVFNALDMTARAGFGKRPALLIIDSNRAFCGDGPLPILEMVAQIRTACGEYAWEAIPKMKQLVDAARKRDVPVIYTTNRFRPDGWDIGSWVFKKSQSGNAAPLTLAEGNEIVADIAPLPNDIIVQKQKPSAFFGTDLVSYLNLLDCDSVIVGGGTTSGCVRASVVDAFSYNYRVTVASDACFDRFQASHAIGLCDMQSRYADVLPTSDILSFFERSDFPHYNKPVYASD
ncbi:isochorismatase family protein [Mesorhizobium sp. 1B3]|uniref:isochorismatase family protein n=1 Tax=Mesorhizobium sp. 1B3 TaxID=3243599 RepID=UPI003D958C3D